MWFLRATILNAHLIKENGTILLWNAGFTVIVSIVAKKRTSVGNAETTIVMFVSNT